MAEQPTGTVTLLFSDIEGSTGLLQQLGTERYSEALELHRRLLREAFARHGGYEVDYEGDAFFVAFGRAADAVAAAAEAQQALAEAAWPDRLPIQVRMGLHTGEPLATPPKYVGLEVHKAARIMAAGHGGQVVVSAATQGLLAADVALLPLGEHRLKDLLQPEPLYQLVIAGLPDVFPALKTLENRPTNLPVQPTPLIGRERELADVAALLGRDDLRLLTLTGPGGTGKTRLALQAAAELLDAFADGVYFVALAPIRDPALFVSTVAQALGLREQPGEELLDTVGAYLHDKATLLLLDNLEQLAEAGPEIAALLRAAPTLNVLATSRAPLRLSGERLYPVPPLALPEVADLADAATVGRYEAVRLFIERAQAVRPDFVLTADNAPTVAEICVRLDGLPLAVELAAARTPVLSPQALLARLDQRLKLLTGGSRDLEERQQTLRATIEWSYDLLPEPEQLLFARLGIFAGGCRIEAAEAVCDPDGDLGIDLIDGLSALVDKSLLRQRNDPDGEPRFWMLETIREYAVATTPPPDRGGDLAVAYVSHYANLAVWAEPELLTSKQPGVLDRLDADRMNLRQAIEWAIERNEHELALTITGKLFRYWDVRGYISDGYLLCERALAASAGKPTLARADTLLAASFLSYRLGGDQHVRSRRADEALEIYTQLRDQTGIGRALIVLATARNDAGRLAEAKTLMTRALDHTQAAHDDYYARMCKANLADIALRERDFAAAAAWAEQVIASRDAHDLGLDDSQVTAALNGAHALVRVDDPQALSAAQSAVRLAAELDSPSLLGTALLVLAAASARSDPPRAAILLGAADALNGSLHQVWETAEAELHNDLQQRLAQFLDGHDLHEALQRGNRFDRRAAITYALNEGSFPSRQEADEVAAPWTDTRAPRPAQGADA